MKHYLISALILLSATPAAAQVIVLGQGSAQSCYLAAKAGNQGSQSAMADCDAALKGVLTRKHEAATHINRGVLLMRKGEYELSVEDYQAALRINPKMSEAHINHGVALFHLGEFKQSRAAYDRALALGTEKEAITRYNRALVAEQMGDLRDAYDDLQIVVTMKPDWDLAQDMLSRFTLVSSES